MDSGALKETVVNVPVTSCSLELFGSSDSKDFESYVFLDKGGQLRNLFSTANYEIEVSEMHLADQLNPVELSDCSLQSDDDYYLNVECSSIPSDLTLVSSNVDPAPNKLSSSICASKIVPFTSLSCGPSSPLSSSSVIDNDIIISEDRSCTLVDDCLISLENPAINTLPVVEKDMPRKDSEGNNQITTKTLAVVPKKNGVAKSRLNAIPALIKSKNLKKFTKLTPSNSLISKKLVKQEQGVITPCNGDTKESTTVNISTIDEKNTCIVFEQVENARSEWMNTAVKKSEGLVLKEDSLIENSSKTVKPNLNSLPDVGDEKPVSEALQRMGISDEELNKLQMDVGNQKVWFCPQNGCMYNASRMNWLKTHLLQTHYDVRPYKCDHENCSWSFFSSVKLKRHKETHLKKKIHKCDLCERSFTTVYNLHTHLKLHKRPADIVCPVEECNAAFQTKRNLELHLRVHKEIPAPYRCERKDCGKSYYSRNALRSHSRGHIYSEEDLKCSFCSKMFDKPCRLKAHVRSHTGVKPYRCKFEGCSWAFTTSSKLSRHMCKHTNIRKYPCSIEKCGKSFLRPEHLRDHVLTHFTEKAFLCPVSSCNGAFSARSSLYVHLKKVHNNAKDGETKRVGVGDGPNCHSCVIKGCDYQFSSKEDLKSHLIYQHVHSIESVAAPDTLPSKALLKSEPVDMDCLDPLETMNLLGTDENLSSLNALTCSNDESSISGINLNLGPEGLSVSLPELVSNNSDFNSISPSFGQPEDEPKLPTESALCEIVPVMKNEAPPKKVYKSAFNLEESMTADLRGVGCARTCLTLKDVRNKVNRRRGGSSGGRLKKQSVDLNENLRTELLPKTVFISSHQETSIPPCLRTSDVTLPTSWLDDNLSPLMLQDDLHGGAELYETNQDDSALMGASSNELQVFLFDSGPSSRHCDFEQSTINLRDLE